MIKISYVNYCYIGYNYRQMPTYTIYYRGKENDPVFKITTPDQDGVFDFGDGKIEQKYLPLAAGMVLHIRDFKYLNRKRCEDQGCVCRGEFLSLNFSSPKVIHFSRQGDAVFGSGNPFIRIER